MKLVDLEPLRAQVAGLERAMAQRASDVVAATLCGANANEKGLAELRAVVDKASLGLGQDLHEGLTQLTEALKAQVEAVKDQTKIHAAIASQLKRLNDILAPQAAGGSTSFRAGYEEATPSPDTSWIGTTDEVQGYMREQLTRAFGRPLTPEEEDDFKIGPEGQATLYGQAQNQGPSPASRSFDGFSQEAGGVGPEASNP